MKILCQFNASMHKNLSINVEVLSKNHQGSISVHLRIHFYLTYFIKFCNLIRQKDSRLN